MAKKQNQPKEMKIAFPTDVKHVKLWQVMNIHAIQVNEKMSDVSKKFFSLAQFLLIEVEQLAKARMKDINMIYLKMNQMLLIGGSPEFHRIITVGGQKFGFIPDMDAVEGSEFMDIDALSQEGFKNYNKMLAVLYRPIQTQVGDRYTLISYMKESDLDKHKREKLFLKEMSYHDARGGLHFFLKFSQISTP